MNGPEIVEAVRAEIRNLEQRIEACRQAERALIAIFGDPEPRVQYVKGAPEKGAPVLQPSHFRGAKAKPGDKTCKECGRTELKGQPGPGGYVVFHYSPEPCGLPCSGANLKTCEREDLADGVHSKRSCPR